MPSVRPRQPGKHSTGTTGAIALTLGFTVLLLTVHIAEGAVVPSGFLDTTVVTGLTAPTAMAFAPDGRLFVCEQAGAVRIIQDGVLLAAPFVSLTVDSSGERGLIGIAFDPDFSTNGFVYLHYTVPAAGSVAPFNRVTRFTASGNAAVPGSEVEIIRMGSLTGATNHNGGGLQFAPDGTLLIGVGENATASNAQSLNNLLGKLLRINSDGSIPPDNPFYGTATGKNRAIWALGLRNPFTFAIQPETGQVFINDVGAGTYEEIDNGSAGANFGWPSSEGPTGTAGHTAPLYYYGHGTGPFLGCAIAGGTFYSPSASQFPEEFLGDYFFADLCGGWINRREAGTGAVSTFATGISQPVDLDVAADGSLYYLARGPQSGRVGRIEYLLEELASSPMSPFNVGTPITWTALPGRVGLEYQFWLYNDTSKSWSIGQPYGSSNTWVWPPSQTGVYAVQVWVRQAGSGVSYHAWAGTNYFSVGTPTIQVSLAANRAFPFSTGTPVTWTASASGSANLEYQFWLYNDTSKSWSIRQPYGSSNTWVWPPSQTGVYAVQVWVRQAGSGVSYHAWAGTNYFSVGP
jgi:glucose/arabinose dehydrogenase